MAEKQIGIKLLQRYEEAFAGVYNKKLEQLRSKISARAIEEKAWELVGASNLYNKRKSIEKKIREVEGKIEPVFSVICATGESPYSKVIAELKLSRFKRAFAEISGEAVRIYNEYEETLDKLSKLKEKLRDFGWESSSYNWRDKFEAAYKKVEKEEESLIWELLGVDDLVKEKEKLIQELTDVAEEEKEFTGGACEVKRELNRKYFFIDRPVSDEAPIEGARWQAKELLYPEIRELKEKFEEARLRTVSSLVPAEAATVLKEFQEEVKKL